MPFQIPTCSSTYGQQTMIKIETTKHRNNKENNKEDEQNKKVLNKTNIFNVEKLEHLKTTPISSPCFATSFYSNKTLFSLNQQMFSSFLLFIVLFVLFLPVQIEAQSNGKCYSFAPGLTILGADYRRDFGLSRRQCADVCKTDVCCMAFEWQRIGGQCTLKSRSLNGTVVNLGISNGDENAEKSNDGKDLLFALCLDYGDSERDRFWDHELGGPIVATKIDVERENCAKVCAEFSTIKKRKITIEKVEEEEDKENEGEEFDNFKLSELTLFARNIKRRAKRPIHKFPKIEKSLSSGKEAPAVIYNWRPVDPTDMESPLGECQCISVLQHIKLNFGSFSGFLI
uniref:Apple domain-containing protein n=1 Tax=Meloidogyne enterolobii TaxID=390850 RepID=A0A6V7X0A4_MELEN|nr:unnamed protein product [Meloidogyne enterolobii]